MTSCTTAPGNFGLLFWFHAFGLGVAWRGRAAKSRTATFGADVLHFCFRAFTDTDDFDRAIAAGAQMFRAGSHHIDMSLFSGCLFYKDSLALGANHDDNVVSGQIIRLRLRLDLAKHHQMLATFHRLHWLGLVLRIGRQPCGQCHGENR